MTVDEWLKTRAKILADNGNTSSRLDCVLMLERALQRDRGHIIAHLDDPLTRDQARALEMMFARRYKHEPMAYVLGHAEFYGRPFIVNRHVLVPRPESESIIELAKAAPAVDAILDVGTGSGALAITLALERIAPEVTGLDIDPACVEVAQQNAQQLGASVTFVRSDMLADWQPSTSVSAFGIVANLPYVPDEYPVNDAARHEPALALFSGADGLDHYHKLFAHLPAQTAWVITEALLSQHEQLAALAKTAGYQLMATDGLAQYFSRA